MAKMSVTELRSIVSAQRSQALAPVQSSLLTEQRQRADDYYQGNMESDLPADEGSSSAVSTDVSDAIEGLMPQLMDIFAGSDEVVRFEPVGPQDEDQAQQESDFINHVFMQLNAGFMVLYTMIKDALLSKVGIVKIWWEKHEKEETENYFDLSDDQFSLLAMDVLQSNDTLKITKHSVRDDNGVPLHDVEVTQTTRFETAKCMAIPPEEFGIARNARTIKDANYCFHEVVTKSRAEYIEEGFDADQINAVEEYNGLANPEEVSRDSVWEHADSNGSTNKSSQFIKVTEHYLLVDYQGNGKPKLYQVITGGTTGEILRCNGKECIEEWDHMPFAACTPIPITHRFFGRSIADLVMEIQKIKTALLRGGLDNLYAHNRPRPVVTQTGATENTLDDLMMHIAGAPIRVMSPDAITWTTVPDISGGVWQAMQYMDGALESRTGITKQGQGIDANALQNQSATAVAQVFSASQMRMKMVARVLGEGIKDIFWLLHETCRKHGTMQQQVQLRSKWVAVDPRNWKQRNHLTIDIGLGNGGKAQQFSQMMSIVEMQKQLIMGGKAHMVGDDKLFNSAAELSKIMGYKNPERFFNDPTAVNPQTGQLLHPPQPPPPDPKLQVAQLQAQNDAQSLQLKAGLEQQKAQNDTQHQVIKTQAEIELERQKADLQAKLALVDAEIKKDAAQREAQMHMLEMQHKQVEHENKIALMKQQAQAKSEGSSASVHIKHKAEDITEPLSGLITQISQQTQQMADSHAKHAEMIHQAVSHLSKPKRLVRDKHGKAIGVETAE